MKYRTRDSTSALSKHHYRFFGGHEITAERWPVGPAQTRVPRLYLHAIGPGPKVGAWTYATIGVWDAVHDEAGHGTEFVMSRRAIEIEKRSRCRDERLHRAELVVLEQSLVRAVGLADPTGAPLAHLSPVVTVRAGHLEAVPTIDPTRAAA